MKRLLLAGREFEREKILSILQEVGVIHVEPIDPAGIRVPPDLIEEISQATKALEILAGFVPAEGTIDPPGTPSRLVDEVCVKSQLLAKLQTDRSELERQRTGAAPWGRIDAKDLDELRKNGLFVEFLLAPRGFEDKVTADLAEPIAEIDGVFHILAVSRAPIASDPVITRFPQPPHDVFQIDSALSDLTKEEKELRETLSALSRRSDSIRSHLSELLERKRWSEVETSLGAEGPAFLMRGWIPSQSVHALENGLSTSGVVIGMDLADPDEGEAPPTLFDNPVWCKPIEPLFTFLGIIPGYREADISIFFLPFLTLFSAMLIGDGGYGIVGLVGLALAYKPLVSRGAPGGLLQLFMIIFGASIFYGLLTNSWFGAPLIPLLSFDAGSPAGMEFLKKLCFFIGAIHLSIAHAWKIRRNPITLATAGEAGWLMFIWAMFGLLQVLVLGAPTPGWMIPLFVVSLFLVLFFTAPSTNILSMVGQGLGAIALNAAGFLSDIISYIRLWAVGMAGGILAASFNSLAKPLPFVAMLVVLVLAHLMNLALCVVAIFAHGVRLNLLEFSNHLGMEWSGKEYKPFRKERQ